MIVAKFAGSSLHREQSFESVVSVVSSLTKKTHALVVVVSAGRNLTNSLLEMAFKASQKDDSYRDLLSEFSRHCERQMLWAKVGAVSDATKAQRDLLLQQLEDLLHSIALLGEASAKTKDLVMSFGERLSALPLHAALTNQGLSPEILEASELILTDDSFGRAQVDREETYRRIRSAMESPKGLFLVNGFLAATAKGETSTLGRGGADYTATLFGAALRAKEVQIWATVEGVMTADPRLVERAFPIERLSYREAMELSHFGARVLFPSSIQPALDRQIPIRVLNLNNKDFSGTLISSLPSDTQHAACGITSISDVALLRVEGSGLISSSGTASRLFRALASSQVSAILISQASSEHSICVAVDPESVMRARESLETEFANEISARRVDDVIVERELSVLAVVGENMRNAPGVASRLFEALAKNGINVIAIAQGSSERNISVVISKEQQAKALNAIHDSLFLSQLTTIHLFQTGIGQVGSKLLEQIKEHATTLSNERGLEIRVAGLATSNKMVLNPKGIDLDSWQDVLAESREYKPCLPTFVAGMKNLNLPNSIFVDCTASQDVSEVYEDVLTASISVVTPNKKANSGKYEQYLRLKKCAAHSNVKFFYEATVGAGLPVIGTLSDLILSGDEVLRIEAVLSGTLSYIFNSFVPGKRFSEVVAEAKALGYTEPDPRDDLSGKDVARKLLILAREMGLAFEEKDVSVESLIPAVCSGASSPQEFMSLLPKADNDFNTRLESAAAKDQVLRYVAKISDAKAKVSIEAVGRDHPFYSLKGSDNVISFTTKRYLACPLVVKGPGAGTDVTAAGVFADIVRVATYLR